MDAQRLGRGQVHPRGLRGWGGFGHVAYPQSIRHSLRQIVVNVAQMRYDARPYAGLGAFRKFEHKCVLHMPLLDRGLADIELPGLTIVVRETFRAQPGLLAGFRGLVADIPLKRMGTRPFAPAIGFIIDPALACRRLHMAILLVIADWAALWGVDRQFGKIRTSQAFQLSVQIGKVAPLQQRIIGKIDPRHHILGAERYLFGFGEKVVDGPVQRHGADDLHRAIFLGNQFGGVQHVKVKGIGKILIEQLHTQIPGREISPVNRIPQVAAVPIRVSTIAFDRLVPDHRLQAHLWFPVEFDKCRIAVG